MTYKMLLQSIHPKTASNSNQLPSTTTKSLYIPKVESFHHQTENNYTSIPNQYESAKQYFTQKGSVFT